MRSKWLGCLLVLAASACGDSPDDPAVGPVGPVYDAAVGPVTPGVPGGAQPGGPILPVPVATAGAGGMTGSVLPGSPGGAAAGGGGQNIPCDVQKILVDKCQVCHAEPPVGAPMSLTKLAHFQVNSTYTGKTMEKISQRVKARIADTANPMPPIGRPALTAAEKTTLNNWVSAGALGSAQTCTPTAPVGTGGTGGTAGGGMTGGTLPPTVGCDMTQELRAHGGQTEGDTTPYTASAAGDHYEMFWFKPAWTGKMHAATVEPIIDNGAVLHHWLLYMKESGAEAPGSHSEDIGLQSSDSQLLSGWAPGNKGFQNPADVGLYMVSAPAGRLGIELHYNTSANPPNRKDRSGAKICVVKPRPKEAATHWLGTEIILLTDTVSSVCTVPKESHILAHSPHMHKQGKYMKSIITKKGGGTVKLTDQPFAFTDQQIFPVDSPTGEIVVQPGDVITTTCDWNTFVTFGPGTDSEMCYNFVVAWPMGSLSTGVGLVGGKNTCMQ